MHHLIIKHCRNDHYESDSGLVLLQKLTRLTYLYLGNNELTAVPHLPESLHVVHLHVSSSLIYLEKMSFGEEIFFSVWKSQPMLCSQIGLLQNNKISTITDETFCKGNTSHYIRASMYEVRLDGNPLKLSQHPNSFICLQSLPVGWYK